MDFNHTMADGRERVPYWAIRTASSTVQNSLAIEDGTDAYLVEDWRTKLFQHSIARRKV